LFASITVIAANAGGAWSPIGDVTTTMLWIGGQIEAMATIKALIVPSLVNLIAPLLIISYRFRRQKVVLNNAKSLATDSTVTDFERTLIFFVGIGLLCFVPAFKELTHLPPFMGILFALGILWFCGDLLHQNKPESRKQDLSLTAALRRIDLSSILFFTGILLAVSVLEHAEILNALADFLEDKIGNQTLIIGLLGMLSAMIDNVPLVAASMGMYSLSEFPVNSFTWQFLAYAAGTGGSILIIGSAAGIAAMGLEKIDFFWYVRKISGLALIGYLAGAATYWLMVGA
jgi:Na+/H+ antiporter NhaD/arsenite permease-like protein